MEALKAAPKSMSTSVDTDFGFVVAFAFEL